MPILLTEYADRSRDGSRLFWLDELKLVPPPSERPVFVDWAAPLRAEYPVFADTPVFADIPVFADTPVRPDTADLANECCDW